MKFVAISDTHGYHDDLVFQDVDVIIHSGDFSSTNHNNEIESILFLEWFNDLPIKYKILSLGNHEKYLYGLYLNGTLRDTIKQFFPEIILLVDESIVINGIKIYATPWTPAFHNFSFMKDDLDLFTYFDNIDIDTNILVTHTPSYGILDLIYVDRRVGSNTLRYKINELKDLKFHLFGHIHESGGIHKTDRYTAINASILGDEEINSPIYFELE